MKPTEQTRQNLVRQWLVRFAFNAGQPLDAEAQCVYVNLWLEGFADLSDAMLEAAFRRTLATCKFWPIKIADVLEHVESAQDSRAEDEWQNLLEYCRRHVNADLGMAHAPKLPPDISHAAAAAGGLYFLESCGTNDLQWAKKRFLEDLARQRNAAEVVARLPDSPLARLLEATVVRFALPAATAPVLPPVPENSRPSADAQPHITIKRPANPEFVAWQNRQSERDPAVTAYRCQHGL